MKHVHLVEHEAAESREHVLDKLKEVEALGGEGLMLRKPKSYVLPYLISCSILLRSCFHSCSALIVNLVMIVLTELIQDV